MKGQFFILSAVIISVFLATSFYIFYIKSRYFPPNWKELYRIIDFRNIPGEISSSCVEVNILVPYNYLGPILIETDINSTINSNNGFLDNKTLVVFYDFKEGVNKILVCNESKLLIYFHNDNGKIIAGNYNITDYGIEYYNSSILFQKNLLDWGNTYIEFDKGYFLPNSVLINEELNISFVNFNLTEVDIGYHFYNGSYGGYLVGDYNYNGDNNFTVYNGAILFMDYNASKLFAEKMYEYSIDIVPFDVQFSEDVCDLNLVSCIQNSKRNISGSYPYSSNFGYFSFNSKNFMFLPFNLGTYNKIFGIFNKTSVSFEKILSKDAFYSFGNEYRYIWYSSDTISGISGYLSKNISGNFYLIINSTNSFYLNVNDSIYEFYPEISEINGYNEFFGKDYIFFVNKSVSIEFPVYSIFKGNLSFIDSFYSKGDTNITCDNCQITIFNGPIVVYNGTTSEFSIHSNDYYITCNPYCNVSSDYIYFEFLPEIFFYPFKNKIYSLEYYSKPDDFMKIPVVCINNDCTPKVFNGSFILIEKFQDGYVFLLGGEGYIVLYKNSNVTFSDYGTPEGNEIIFDDYKVFGNFSYLGGNSFYFDRFPPPRIMFFKNNNLNFNYSLGNLEVYGRGVEIR